MLFAEWRGLRTGNVAYRLLARRWAKVLGVLPAAPGLPLVALSTIAGVLSLGLLHRRHFLTARLTAALAVTAVLWAWAAARYPDLLNPGLTISQAAADRPVLAATLVSLGAGAVFLVPSLAWLYILFQRSTASGS